jgi:hypothetical protein
MVLKSSPEVVAAMVREIVMSETEYLSWTLMHRFNKCAEMLGKINVRTEYDVYV